MTDKPIVNIADAALEDRGNKDAFVFKAARLGPALKLSQLGCTLHVVPPGKRAYPFHKHHVADELFYVISGEGSYRHGDHTHPLKAGDVIGAPAGGQAHQIINTGSKDLSYLALSSMGGVDILEYPDTGKIAAAAGIKNADFKTATYSGLGYLKKADYYEGEK